MKRPTRQAGTKSQTGAPKAGVRPLLSDARVRLAVVFADRFRGLVLFGSEARGEAGPDSDVDLLVLLRGPVEFGKDLETVIRALYPLQLGSDRVSEAFPADEEEYRRGEWAFYRNVQREGIPA